MIARYGTDKPRPALKAASTSIKQNLHGTSGTSQYLSMKGVRARGRKTPGSTRVRRNELQHHYYYGNAFHRIKNRLSVAASVDKPTSHVEAEVPI